MSLIKWNNEIEGYIMHDQVQAMKWAIVRKYRS